MSDGTARHHARGQDLGVFVSCTIGHPAEETAATISLRNLRSFEKQVVGCLAGSWDGRGGIEFRTGLHRAGRYNLSSIVTRIYGSLADVMTGYRDQAAGTIVRGAVRLSA
ncbi:hypothetical protein [Frankia sp. Cj5]|uniref:hypothetical protein n=1 Tax=Frankia sp. Cj5 TaxID=2880978 RepID=UPI001EF5E6C8|nr:hypothetical protein [Frankia sp. Cj5]